MHRARRGLRVGMASSPTMRLNGLQNSVHARHIIAMVAVKEVAGGAAKPRHAISIEGMLFAARVKGWLAHFCAMRSEEEAPGHRPDLPHSRRRVSFLGAR